MRPTLPERVTPILPVPGAVRPTLTELLRDQPPVEWTREDEERHRKGGAK